MYICKKKDMKKIKEYLQRFITTIKTVVINLKLCVSLKKKKLFTDKIRKMVIKTFKEIQEKFLKYYFIEIRFSTMDNLNNYKLPIIAHLVDYNEAVTLQQNIIQGLIDKKFNITSIPNQPKEIINLEKTKNEIISSQEINGFNTIKIILEKIKMENGLYSRYVEHESDELMFKINIIGNEMRLFNEIKDLFVIHLDKNILE